MNETILDKTDILERAKVSWDAKSDDAKEKAGKKYQHFLERYKLRTNSWTNNFENLTKFQQNILVKGELIRYYDSLPNKTKTEIMRVLRLSEFSSKWYKLPSNDKKKLLDHFVR